MISYNILNIIVKYIGFNLYIDFECKFFSKNLDKINWNKLSQNEYIPISFLLKHYHNVKWDKVKINSYNESLIPYMDKITNILYNFYEKYIKYVNWTNILCNHNFPYSFIENYLEKIIDEIIWEYMAYDCKYFIKIIQKYYIENNRIIWEDLLYNKHIPLSFLLKCVDENKITWSNLCSCDKILYEDNIEQMKFLKNSNF